jgi:ribosomal protein S18 acetylase RimI-like enzyme
MKIRKGKLNDLEELHFILNNTKELHGEKNNPEQYPRRWIKIVLKDKTTSVLIAEEKNKLAGFFIAEFDKKTKSSYLVDIFVKPEYRKKEFASKLLKEYEKLCREKGIDELTTLVLTDNKKMQSFMKKYNYRQGNKFFYYSKKLK